MDLDWLFDPNGKIIDSSTSPAAKPEKQEEPKVENLPAIKNGAPIAPVEEIPQSSKSLAPNLISEYKTTAAKVKLNDNDAAGNALDWLIERASAGNHEFALRLMQKTKDSPKLKNLLRIRFKDGLLEHDSFKQLTSDFKAWTSSHTNVLSALQDTDNGLYSALLANCVGNLLDKQVQATEDQDEDIFDDEEMDFDHSEILREALEGSSQAAGKLIKSWPNNSSLLEKLKSGPMDDFLEQSSPNYLLLSFEAWLKRHKSMVAALQDRLPFSKLFRSVAASRVASIVRDYIADPQSHQELVSLLLPQQPPQDFLSVDFGDFKQVVSKDKTELEHLARFAVMGYREHAIKLIGLVDDKELSKLLTETPVKDFPTVTMGDEPVDSIDPHLSTIKSWAKDYDNVLAALTDLSGGERMKHRILAECVGEIVKIYLTKAKEE